MVKISRWFYVEPMPPIYKLDNTNFRLSSFFLYLKIKKIYKLYFVRSLFLVIQLTSKLTRYLMFPHRKIKNKANISEKTVHTVTLPILKC